MMDPAEMIHSFCEDRLSSLPNNLIEAILVRLPLQEAFATNVLSHSWRYHWINLPKLVFDRGNFPLFKFTSEQEFGKKLAEIVDHVLLLHRGPIHKFKLSINLFEIKMHLDRWILFVSRNEVTEFILDKLSDQIYKLPFSFFSCDNITHLELLKCEFIPPDSFNGFSYLRTLYLRQVKIKDQNMLQKLISNSPLLTNLDLCYVEGYTHLTLCAPNLVNLRVEGHGEPKHIVFANTPVLAVVSIVTEYSFNKTRGICRSFSKISGTICGSVSILASVPSIQSLKLTYQTPESSAPIKLCAKYQLSTMAVVINFQDQQELFATLEIFKRSPYLQEVIIIAHPGSVGHRRRLQHLLQLWESQYEIGFKGIFRRLLTVQIRDLTGSKSEMKFVEFILGNAPALKSMKIDLKYSDVDDHEIDALREINRFRRLSSEVEVDVV